MTAQPQRDTAAILAEWALAKWLKRLFAATKPRHLVCVSYYDADVLLRENKAWRIAPEEDRNTGASRRIGMVYLERDAASSENADG